jgi:hypothetical protein
MEIIKLSFFIQNYCALQLGSIDNMFENLIKDT